MSRRLLLLPWIVLAAAFVLRMMEAGMRGNFGLLFYPFKQQYGWDRGSVSLAMSIGMIVWALMLPLGGRLCDRFGPRRVMAVGFTLMIVSLLGSSTATSLWHLYFWWGLVGGLGWGLGATVGAVTLAARWFPRRRGLAMSVSISGVSAGTMVVVPIGAALFKVTDWQGVLWALAGIIALVSFPILLLVVKDMPPAQTRQEEGLSAATPKATPRVPLLKALRSGPYAWIVAIYAPCGIVGMAEPVHLIPYALDKGMSTLEAARAMSVFSAMSIAGVLAFGAISDRLGRKNLLALGYILRLVGLLVLVAARNEPTLLLAVLLLGLGFNTPGGLIPALVADVYGWASVGLLMGFLSLVHQVAGALGVWSIGYLFDATGSYAVPFLIMAGLSVLSAVGSLFIREKRLAAASVPTTAP